MLRAVIKLEPDIVHIVKPRAYAGIVQWVLWMLRLLPLPPINRRKTPRIFLDIDDWEQAWNEISGYSWSLSRFLTWQEEWGIRHADGITAASRWLEERAAGYAPDTPILYLPNGVFAPAQRAITPKLTLQRVAQTPVAQMPVAQMPVAQMPVINSAIEPPYQILYFSRYVEVAPEWLARFWIELQRISPNGIWWLLVALSSSGGIRPFAVPLKPI